LQTSVYALYPVPTIVCAAIFLATRKLGIALPSLPAQAWWELFDTEWDDMEAVCAYIIHLYQPRSAKDSLQVMGLLSKKDVRKWLDDQQP
jgi:hypothetical protein